MESDVSKSQKHNWVNNNIDDDFLNLDGNADCNSAW